ncbi:phage tail protein [Jeongeupia wiesaeckerbachi]|uniref:phage tail protein n=1 Tax=Jeongeupia wiesaeckerbachi TaxID=3051218 RepID=UPI003D806C8C
MADELLQPPLASDARFQVLGDLASRLNDIDLSPLLVYMIDSVDASALYALAEQFSLTDSDGWALAETETAQRALIKRAIEIHRYKGTPWAVREVFRLLGLGEIEIEEGRGGYRRDGTCRRDGFAIRGTKADQWAVYRIKCFRQLSIKQAEEARRMLASVAPARCALFEIDFSAAALIRNGFARRDGTYTRGSI